MCAKATNQSVRQPYSAEVRQHLGRPVMFINDEAFAPVMYSLTDAIGGRWTWEEIPQANLKLFGENGVRLMQIDLWLSDIWSEDGKLDMATARKQVRGALDACEQAIIFIRVHINAPTWWNRKYPEECVGYSVCDTITDETWGLHKNGITDLDEPCLRHSMASERWRRDMMKTFKRFMKELAKSPEGNAVASVQIACGGYGEWHYYGAGNFPDNGPAMTAAFRKWLTDKYKNDKTLKEAWKDKRVTLKNASVPSLKERKTATAGVFRDPQKEQSVIDYYQCQHKAVADNIIMFSEAAKKSWPRDLIVGTFYGYFLWADNAASCGHIEMKRMYESPYVDFLSAPPSYAPFCRRIGGTGQARGIIESARLNGKLWLDEMDEHTHLGQYGYGEGTGREIYAKDTADSIAIIRRNFMQPFTKGAGLWYYDFGPKRSSGWWHHPDLQKEIADLRRLAEKHTNKKYESDAEVLIIGDSYSYYYLSHPGEDRDPVDHIALNRTTADLHYCGASFDFIYMCDIKKVNIKQYRAVIFLNTQRMTKGERDFIKINFATDGRNLVYMYAPGYCDESRLDKSFVEDLTGIKLRKNNRAINPQISVSGKALPKASFGVNGTVAPFLTVDDKDATTMGKLNGTTQTAIARKIHKSHTVWFSSLPITGVELWARVLDESGVHRYTSDTRDVFFSGMGYLCIHTIEGGKRTLTLRNGKKVNLNLTPRSTTILNARTGKALTKDPVETARYNQVRDLVRVNAPGKVKVNKLKLKK